MFLEIEGEELINVMLIERYKLRRGQEVAILWVGGVMLESKLAYAYLSKHGKNLIVTVDDPVTAMA